MTKQCTKCKEVKELDQFYKSKRGLHGHRSWCNICERDKHKEWVSNNPEKIAAIDKRFTELHPGQRSKLHKRYLKSHPEIVDARRIKKRYGLNMDQYRALFTHQNDCCAICKKHKSVNELGLHLDHNHSNKKVRGLLCPSCNQALGLLQDNPELCRLAALYLIDDGKWIEQVLNPDPINSHGKDTSG